MATGHLVGDEVYGPVVEMISASSIAWMEGGPHLPESTEWRVVRSNDHLSFGRLLEVRLNGAQWVIHDGVLLHPSLRNSEPTVANRKILNERSPSAFYAPA